MPRTSRTLSQLLLALGLIGCAEYNFAGTETPPAEPPKVDTDIATDTEPDDTEAEPDADTDTEPDDTEAEPDADTDTEPDADTETETEEACTLDNLTFAEASVSTTRTTPGRIATGDLDGNGSLDLAVINGTATISLFLNQGGGGYSVESLLSLTNDGDAVQVRDISLGDLDGDGDLDLVLPLYGTAYRGGEVQVLLNDGHGQFTLLDRYDVVGNNTISATQADFNGDGRMDFAVSTNNGGWRVEQFLQQSDGAFVNTFQSSVGRNPHVIRAGTFNGDTAPDVAAGVYYSGTMVALNRADGTGELADSFQADAEEAYSDIAVADLNSDGLDDIVARSGTATNETLVRVMINDGAGAAILADVYAVDSADGLPVIGDVDCDGVLDLVVPNRTANTLSILLGQGNGSFVDAVSVPVCASPMGPAIGDFDGDGQNDIALYCGDEDTLDILFF